MLEARASENVADRAEYNPRTRRLTAVAPIEGEDVECFAFEIGRTS
jgi:hypothetical protein